MTWALIAAGLALCPSLPSRAAAEERRHGIDVTLDASVGYLAYRVRRVQRYESGDRFALLDVDTKGSSAVFGGALGVGYKLVLSSKFALTPLAHVEYARGPTGTQRHNTPSYSYPLAATPKVFAVMLGAEFLLLQELLGLQIGIGGGTLKLHDREAAKGGPALLLLGRIRLPLGGALAASLGLGVEVHRLSPLGLGAGTPEQSGQSLLRVGVEFDGSYDGGAS